MSKALLMFRIPQEQWEHESALYGNHYRLALKAVQEHCFQRFDEGDYSAKEKAVYQEIMDLIQEEVSELPPL